MFIFSSILIQWNQFWNRQWLLFSLNVILFEFLFHSNFDYIIFHSETPQYNREILSPYWKYYLINYSTFSRSIALFNLFFSVKNRKIHRRQSFVIQRHNNCLTETRNTILVSFEKFNFSSLIYDQNIMVSCESCLKIWIDICKANASHRRRRKDLNRSTLKSLRIPSLNKE